MSGVAPKIDEILKRGTRDEQVQALCALARELLAKNETDGALTVMDRTVRLDGRSAAAWTLRGEILARRNRTGEALGSFDRALEQDAKLAAALVGKADLLLRIGSYTEAIECYETAVNAFPDVAHVWLNRAKALEGADRHEEAVASVDRALHLSDAPQTWVRRGEILAKAGKHDEAKVSYERAVIIDPSAIDAWFALALAASKTKDIETAKRACYRFLDFGKPDDPRIAAMRSLLFQLDRHGSTPKPVDSRRPARRISSSRMRRMSSRAMKALRPPDSAPVSSGPRSEPGPDSGRLVAEVEDDDFEATLAELVAADHLHREGKNVDALRKLELLVTTAPEEINAWVLRARVLLAMGKVELALASAEQAVTIDVSSLGGWKLVARAFLTLKKLDRAIDAVLRAENLAPKDAEVHRLRGECLVIAERHAEAAIAFEKAVLYSPADADGWLALGRVLRLLRRPGPARDALEKARDLGDSSARPEIASEARGLLDRLG